MKSEPNCIFCKIVGGQIPSPRLYEDDAVICIRDIQPQAKTHLLVVAKEHVTSLDTMFPKDGAGQTEVGGKMLAAAARIAREAGLIPGGYRTVFNTGSHGGQTIFHVHAHVLGGEPLGGFA